MTPADFRSAKAIADRVIEVCMVGFVISSVFSIALSQGFGALAGLVWLGTIVARGRRGIRAPLLLPQLALLGWSVVSVLAADDVRTGLIELRSAWIPIVVFLIFVNRDRAAGGPTLWLRLLLATATLVAVQGLVQTAIHGLDFRVKGTLGHYMTYSGVMLLVLPLALAWLLFARRGWRDRWLFVAVPMMLAALGLTQTRSAWLGLLVAGLLLVSLWRVRFLLAVPLLAVLLVLLAPPTIRERVMSTFDRKNVTAVERLYMWSSGLEVFLDHPLVGVGPGNLRRVYPEYRHPDDPWLEHRRFTHVHNDVIQIAAERGGPALLAWLWLWVVFFVRAGAAHRRLAPADRETRALTAGSMAAISGFLVMGLFEYNWGNTEVMTLAHLVMALSLAAAASPAGAEGRDGAAGGGC